MDELFNNKNLNICCKNCHHTFLPKEETPTISKRRMLNFIKAYHKIIWKIDSLELTVLGWGDRPAFQINGYWNKEPKLKVRFHSFTPGGGLSRIYVFNRKWVRICPAPFINAEKVMDRVYSYYRKNIKRLE